MDEIDQNKLIDKYERLFAEEGWRELLADMTERQRQLKDRLVVDTSITDRTLGIAQGQNSVYDFLINLEATIEAVKQAQREAVELPELGNAYQ